MADPVYYKGANPLITLGDTPVDLSCPASGISVVPEQDTNNYKTFCGGFSTASSPTWTLTIKTYQSFGADGVETAARPLVGQTLPFQVAPFSDTEPGTVDNPLCSGVGTLLAFPFLDSDAGEPTELELTILVDDQPVFSPPDPVPTVETQAKSSKAKASASA